MSLTVVGWQRAGALVERFDTAFGAVRTGLTRPTHLFASNPSNQSRRSLETVTPLSQRLKAAVKTAERPPRRRMGVHPPARWNLEFTQVPQRLLAGDKHSVIK
jgi:hypothetical protein